MKWRESDEYHDSMGQLFAKVEQVSQEECAKKEEEKEEVVILNILIPSTIKGVFMEDFWHQNYALLDLLLETNMSIGEIAKDLGISQAEVQRKQKDLGLSWIRRRDRKMSRGQGALTQIMRKLIPGAQIINEYHIGERLMVDVYCPKYKLAAEYHGRQHFQHISRFHETIGDFERAVERDQRKADLCKEQGITLVIFRYNDVLTEDLVYDRLLGAIQADDSGIIKKPKVKSQLQSKSFLTVKGNPYYEEAKERRRKIEKELRHKIREERKKK
jgi:hypothetical protein